MKLTEGKHYYVKNDRFGRTFTYTLDAKMVNWLRDRNVTYSYWVDYNPANNSYHPQLVITDDPKEMTLFKLVWG
jgi:hypothetical protein